MLPVSHIGWLSNFNKKVSYLLTLVFVFQLISNCIASHITKCVFYGMISPAIQHLQNPTFNFWLTSENSPKAPMCFHENYDSLHRAMQSTCIGNVHLKIRFLCFPLYYCITRGMCGYTCVSAVHQFCSTCDFIWNGNSVWACNCYESIDFPETFTARWCAAVYIAVSVLFFMWRE
jgi:hypothetical protein